ncbi:single-stranded DNA-binding protein [Brevibacterium litoralis]|uniref:single-stranded DNA-binding protein n=1 Tax=Brevibacterium litoralis TaxID=3138935 RepID=UPI0032EC7D3E
MKLVNHLVGNAGGVPVRRRLPDGKEACSFGLAVNHTVFDREKETFDTRDTSWFRVQVYGPMVRNVAFSVQKGTPVVVIGRIRIHKWADEKTGELRSEVQVVADHVAVDLRFQPVELLHIGVKPRPEEDGPDPDEDKWDGLGGDGKPEDTTPVGGGEPADPTPTGAAERPVGVGLVGAGAMTEGGGTPGGSSEGGDQAPF